MITKLKLNYADLCSRIRPNNNKGGRAELAMQLLEAELVKPYKHGKVIRVYSLDQFRTYDYYPDSGKWMCRNDGRWQYGIKNLIKHVKGEQ